MAAASCVLSEEQFRCSICLDIFTDPVSIPCGHNFCKNCITENWNVNAQCECPLCKKVLTTRPELQVNTFISEMAAQFRHSTVKKARKCSLQKSSSSGDVLCDVCSEAKVKAMKSCLMCLTSYCEAHLEFHQKMIGPTKHELIDPVVNLADRMCEGHKRPLEMFCKTDQTCVCLSCTESNHRLHSIVPLVEQYEEKKAELKETEAEIQKRIQERRLKIEEIKESVKLSREDADKEKSDSKEVFSALIRSVEEGLAELLDLIEEKHKENERKAEGFIQELEDEINVLIKRGTEVEQASTFEDHLQFLQNFLSMNPAPETKVWTNVRVHSSHHATVREAVTKMKKMFCEEVEKQRESELKMMKQYAVDNTLDSYTAHPRLKLSHDRKKVEYDKDERTVYDNSCRFTSSAAVLGNKGVSSGKFYFEVLVKDFPYWSLGVAPGSLNRSQRVAPCTETGPWVLVLNKGTFYSALSQWSPDLSLESKPRKIGVFVDYEVGQVSFYNENTAEHMYSFTGCKFTGTLYPFLDLSSADNGDHLIMTNVWKG